jgi:PAS domain S-box-containing protein
VIEETNISYKEIFHSSTEGILVVSKAGKIIIANPSAEKIFRYEQGELKNKSLEDLLPARFKMAHVAMRESFNNNPGPRRMGVGRDLWALRKDGTEFPVEISLSYTQNKGEFAIMAFIIDITQRKKAEDGLKRSEEQLIIYATELEKKVEARTEALNISVSKLEKEVKERKRAEYDAKKSLEKERELNEMKSKFVSIASHEFRTPLSSILSSVSLIDQYRTRGEITKQEKHIHRIKSSVHHLTSILNDFLSLGKLEEGKLEVMHEPVDIGHFMSEVADEMRPSLKPGQHIVIVLQKNISITSDTRIMRNILFNLISNASKYSDPNKNITINISHTSETISISVTDQGIGIPQEDLKHLAERFFRASNATNIQGTGLGLHIVKRYAELLKGNLTFTSIYGTGSTFTITLPLD